MGKKPFINISRLAVITTYSFGPDRYVIWCRPHHNKAHELIKQASNQDPWVIQCFESRFVVKEFYYNGEEWELYLEDIEVKNVKT